jgi:hypothetical protein
MNQSKRGSGKRSSALRQFGWVALCLLVLLGLLFWDGLLPGRTVFSNDGPLGRISSQCARLPANFSGCWEDLTWLGGSAPSASPDVSSLLALALGPLGFSKVYAPFALLFLGLSAWLCFRQWKFSPAACMIGAIAAALNSGFFSTACWGVAAQPLSFGLDFLALAALADQTSPRRWVRILLAGFAVGLGVMEAFDIGAIFSLAVAAFVIYQALLGEGSLVSRAANGIARLALVAGCAAFIAMCAVSSLIGTQIKGVIGMGQDAESKAQRWDDATQWSMPKGEALSVIVPGIYGFRPNAPDGSIYWGRCGRSAVWDRYFASNKTTPRPNSNMFSLRYGGSGLYAGVVVVLLALWAVVQSWRKQGSVFSPLERRFVWFWSSMLLLCVIIGFGRFAPFYRVFYGLPFASTMRSPGKFFHVVQWTLVILCAYGVHGLCRSGLETPAAVLRGLSAQLKAWWSRAGRFDKNWVCGSALALGLSVAGWWIYASSHERLVAYLQEVDFDEGTARAIASFSIQQVGWFLLFLTLGLAFIPLIMSGYFNGRRAGAGALLLGVLIAIDLGRANVPWVVTWDWERKYASNPVIDFLKERPYEHRVAALPFNAPQQFALFGGPRSGLYYAEWLQQVLPYYNVQSLDEIMNPRPRVDEIAYRRALAHDGTTNTLYRITRDWELTNTRYLLGPAFLLEVLNQQVDLGRQRFRIATTFDLRLKPGIRKLTAYDELTAVIETNGAYAVFEFTGALPRAKLYANWQVSTNDQATLTALASASLQPDQAVLVADALPAPNPSSAAQPDAGTVDFVSYAPKDLVLQAKAGAPAVLLLNDRFDPNWKVRVDGKPQKLLRCNYLVRGVYLTAGAHKVEFRFAPPIGTLYVSLAGVGVALLLVGYLAFSRNKLPIPPPPGRPSPAVSLERSTR